MLHCADGNVVRSESESRKSAVRTHLALCPLKPPLESPKADETVRVDSERGRCQEGKKAAERKKKREERDRASD